MKNCAITIGTYYIHTAEAVRRERTPQLLVTVLRNDWRQHLEKNSFLQCPLQKEGWSLPNLHGSWNCYPTQKLYPYKREFYLDVLVPGKMTALSPKSSKLHPPKRRHLLKNWKLYTQVPVLRKMRDLSLKWHPQKRQHLLKNWQLLPQIWILQVCFIPTSSFQVFVILTTLHVTIHFRWRTVKRKKGEDGQTQERRTVKHKKGVLEKDKHKR